MSYFLVRSVFRKAHFFFRLLIIRLQDCSLIELRVINLIPPIKVAARSEAVGLLPLACWKCGFESRQGRGCVILVNVVLRIYSSQRRAYIRPFSTIVSQWHFLR